MTGFQIFLCVLAGIIAFFVLVFSIPVRVSFSYHDKLYLTVKYLFVKINILPLGEKKKKKPKKEKKPKDEKEEKPKEEKPKEKKPNPIVEMVRANGYDGMMTVIKNLGSVFGTYGGKLLKSVVFDEFDIYIIVGKGDAAQTAIEYGKTCQKVYPVAGFLCSNNVVHKYDVSVESDFLANKSQGEIFIDFHLVIRKIINSTVGMVFRLIFKVVLKFLKGARKKKTPETNQSTEQNG